jgi:hypothetical protein
VRYPDGNIAAVGDLLTCICEELHCRSLRPFLVISIDEEQRVAVCMENNGDIAYSGSLVKLIRRLND